MKSLPSCTLQCPTWHALTLLAAPGPLFVITCAACISRRTPKPQPKPKETK